MDLKFYKFHGSGNDFIMVDNRFMNYGLSINQISKLCNRNIGIGADGVIFIEKSEHADFKMIFYNSNGLEGSFCGNGARCAVAFTNHLGVFFENCFFDACDGLHQAYILEEDKVKLYMKDVSKIFKNDFFWELNTGSPHLVYFKESIDLINVKNKGAEIRNTPSYAQEGININFVLCKEIDLFIRTYERGVEDETLSCGTGAVASAIAAFESGLILKEEIKVHTLGGLLVVKFKKQKHNFCNISLTGEAKFVYEGKINI